MNARLQRSRPINAIVIALLALFLPKLVFAGAFSPCADPIVFGEARVSVYLLPGETTGPLSSAAQQLATILQRHVLYAALKYPAIAVEELSGSGSQCTLSLVRKQIEMHLHKGQAVIYVRSRLFERANILYLQTVLDTYTRDPTAPLSWPTGIPGSRAVASIPDDSVVFGPRAIPLDLLSGLQNADQRSRRLHVSPNETSHFDELPSDPAARFAFQVLGTDGDWMHVTLRFGPGGSGQSGWLPAHALASGAFLKGAFPELYFLDALVGYRELQSDDLAKTERPAIRDYVDQALTRYAEQSRAAENDARALAQILQANAALMAEPTEWSVDQLHQALRGYQAAHTVSPAYTVASNHLLACATALCARGACTVEQADGLHKDFLAAVSLDPANGELLSNLAAYYAAADDGRINTSLSADTIATQRRLVTAAQAAHVPP